MLMTGSSRNNDTSMQRSPMGLARSPKLVYGADFEAICCGNRPRSRVRVLFSLQNSSTMCWFQILDAIRKDCWLKACRLSSYAA